MFGNRIKQLREEKKMTQVQLATVMGVTEETVALWEQGKQEPCIAMSIKLADYFNCTTDYLFGRSDFRDLYIVDLYLGFLSLDEYGKKTVMACFKREYERCKAMGTLQQVSEEESRRIKCLVETIERSLSTSNSVRRNSINTSKKTEVATMPPSGN